MVDAIGTYVRYETSDVRTKDHKPETRREYNERFNQDTGPLVYVPDSGKYIWNWFFDIRNSVTEAQDGQAVRIPPSEYVAWAVITGEIVYPWEWSILRRMDAAYCGALNVELSEHRVRQEEWRSNK